MSLTLRWFGAQTRASYDRNWRNTKVKTRGKKLAALAAAASIALTGLGTATASAQELPGTTKVHNGMLFTTKTDGSVSYCTMGVVGTDGLNRKIGITAGHCVSIPDHPLDQVNITDDSMPIYSYTSSANILADLRTRDLASGQDGSVVGAGFQVTTNP